MASQPFHGILRTDRRYDTRYDMWVKGDGTQVLIGATAFGLHIAGKIIAFTAKPRGAEVMLGRGLGTVESAKTVIAVHAPLSFRLDEANEIAEERPQLINDAPYDTGWMVRGRPLAWDDEHEQLIDAASYLAHIRAMDPDAQVELLP